MLKNQKGFTLMELMIVIVIIGVLAAIGVPAYRTFTDKARRTACQANQRTIATVVSLYRAEKGSDPADCADTSALVAGGAGSETLADYLDNIADIKCPVTGKGYLVTGGIVTCSDANHN